MNKLDNKPLNPYDGNEPYIFCRYASEDEELAYGEIKYFQDMGYNVWYNRDNLSEKNLKYISALKNCSVYVLFLTVNSSHNKRIIDEVDITYSLDKNIIPIYLEDIEIDLRLEYSLTNSKRISKFNLDDNQYDSVCKESFRNFGLKSSDDSLETKLIPGVGREPLPAFRGEGQFMFISYAHIDSNLVFPEIKRFQDLGYNVWYDEGIGAGNEWLRDVLEHLVASDLFIVFITNNSVASKNVQKEIKFAVSKEKNIIPIYLEDFDKIKMDLQLEYELQQLQGILKTTLDEEEYVFKFTEAFQRFGFELEYGDIFERKELKSPEEVLMDDALKNQVLYSDIDSGSIKAYLDEFFENLVLSVDDDDHSFKELLKLSIEVFLNKKYNYTALDVYNTFFTIYQLNSTDNSSNEFINTKNRVLDLINIIKDNNYDTDVQKNIFIHSVNVFILGLAIYSRNNNYEEAFKYFVRNSDYDKYYNINGELSDEEFLYRWGITSLLHDIYYPFEKNGRKENRKIFKEFDNLLGNDRIIEDVTDLNDMVKKDPYDFTDKYSKRHPETKFFNLFKYTDIIAHKISLNLKLDGKNSDLLLKHINNFIYRIKETEFAEHAFLSSLLLLNVYDNEIQEYDVDSDFFFYPIVDGAVAIFLHNYYQYFLQKEPFNQKLLNPFQNPLAYLLILCDNILEFYKPTDNIIDSEVNKIIISQLNNKILEIKYEINSTSYGFGFSNELHTDEIIDLSDIFKEISTKNDLNKINDDKILSSSTYSSFNNASMNLIEVLAKETYKHYQNSKNELNTTDNNSNNNNFSELSPQKKIMNIRQAKTLPKKLQLIGYEIAEITDEREAVHSFSEDEIKYLAKIKHNEWSEEKKANGWKYAKEYDYEKLTNPYIISWEKLNPKIQEKDIEPVTHIPKIIDSIGLKIVPSKLRLLSNKINNMLSNKDFNSLPQYCKRLKYKQTALIIETLSELDYYVVDRSNKNPAVTFFENEEAVYLAQRYHEKWCILNYSLGWKKGNVLDYNYKTDPNLVSWDKEKLSVEYAKLQIKTFKELPKLCNDVDLKIIKNTYEI